MGVISTHQLSSFSSPVNGTSPVDANQVRGNDNAIRSSTNAHDADATIHLQTGLVASRPSPSLSGQTWLATDTGAVYLYTDTGSAWVEANYLRNTGGTVTGNVLITGTLGVSGAVTGGTYNGQTITSAASFTGSVTVANGLTVSAGTTAVQALTATTATLSNVLTLTPAFGFTFSGGNDTGIWIGATNTLYFGDYAVPSKGLRLNFSTGALVSTHGVTVLSGGVAVTGNSTITGTLGGVTVLTVANQVITPDVASNSGATALTLHNGATLVGTFATSGATLPFGISVTGNSTITGTLSGITTLTATTLAGTLSTAAQPNITSVGVLASPHLTSPVVDSGGLTVSAGTSALQATTATSLNLSSGAAVTKFLTLAFTYDVPSIAANSVNTVSTTVTGAAIGDAVFVDNPIISNSVVVTAYVSATDTVLLSFANPTTGAIDPPSKSYKIVVVKVS